MMNFQFKLIIAIPFFFIICLLNMLFFSEKAVTTPNANQCQFIRQLRNQGYQTLDGQDLATLEDRYCGKKRSSKRVSNDCIHLRIIEQLASMTDSNTNLVSMVQTQTKITCQLSLENSSFNWSNGEEAKVGNNWYYPNGEEAKVGNNWYYPNGEEAKIGANWYYPNGNNAKINNNWYYPNGNIVSLNNLILWSCQVVGEKQCDYYTNIISRENNQFWYELRVIQFSWKAEKAKS
jgi:hypothetical protein